MKRWARREIGGLDERLGDVEKRLRQLECPHAVRVFREPAWPFFGGYSEACSSCGKRLNEYTTETAFLAAKARYEREVAAETNLQFKVAQKREKDGETAA